MARFEYIQKYMDTNENAKKLVTCIEDYAKHSYNEGSGKQVFSVDAKYSKIEKATTIQDLYLSEVSRRSGKSLASVDGDMEAYSRFDDVAKMGAFVTSILIDTVYPIYLNQSGLAMLSQFHPVGYAGVVDFEVKDSSLYTVSKMGRRQKHTKVQEKKKTNVVIGTDMYGLTTEVTLPQIMLGDVMIADEAIRMALSFNHHIYKLVLNKFIAKAGAITDTNFKIDSYTEDTFLTILRKGSAINGSKMTIVGDALALKDLLPASNLTRILLTDAYNTTLGYMDVWNTYNVIGFDVVADDSEDSGILGLPTNKIYGIPNDGTALIHVAIGSTRINTDEMYANDNLAILSTLAKEIGVELATTRKVVRCDLAE
jgi:hypothetical protein